MEMEQPRPQATDESRATYLKNYEKLHAILSGGRQATMGMTAEQGSVVTVRLSRILKDSDTDTTVPFEGPAGIEALLARLSDSWRSHIRVFEDGHLVGLTGAVSFTGERGAAVSVPMSHIAYALDGGALVVCISLGPGGQVIVTVGPSNSVSHIAKGLEAADRALHVAAHSMGCNYELLSEGYNPLVSSPLDVALVPCTKNTLSNAHLGQCGRFARDYMRCMASTEVILGYGNEREAIGAFRLASALSPLFMFLTDNIRSFRGSGARRCPRMCRSLIMDEVDPTRSGIVPGTFDRQMSFDRYIEWLMDIQPIYVTDALGTTTSSGKRTLKEVLGDRVLSESEILSLFDCVLPNVRLGKDMELLQADALRPTQAAGYAAFVKGIFVNPLGRDSVWSTLSVNSEADVQAATVELRRKGWDATIYGMRVTDLVARLLSLAYQSISDEERALVENIAEFWEVHMVPRDAFVIQETKKERGW